MPMVELQSPAFGRPLQMDHAQSFEFGHLLIEVTATAISDAMMAGFLADELQFPKNDVTKMLFGFRKYRARMMLSAGEEL